MPVPPNGNFTPTLRLSYGHDDGVNRNLSIIDTEWARLIAGEIPLPGSGDGGSATFTNLIVGSLDASTIHTNTLIAEDVATFNRDIIVHGGLTVDASATIDGTLDTSYLLVDSINFKPGGQGFNATFNGPVVKSVDVVSLDWTKLTNIPPGVASGQATPTGPASGDLIGTYPGPLLKATGAIAGTYGDATNVPRIVVDTKGRITTVDQVAVNTGGIPTGPAGGDLGGSYPSTVLVKGINGAPVGTMVPLARGDLIVANATPALVRLPRGTNQQVLQSNGTDVFWGASIGGPPSGASGGDLFGSTYPNPLIKNGAINTAKLAPGAVAGQLIALRSFDYAEQGRSSSAPFTIATLPGLAASQLYRFTLAGQLFTNTGTFTLSVQSATGWTTPVVLFFYGTVAGVIRAELLIWQNSGGNSYSFSSLTHLLTPVAAPSSAIAANGQQSATSYQAATGTITITGQFSTADGSNALIRLLAVAEQF